MKLKNIIGHFNTINKHRWIVFKLSVRAGIPLRGLLHDLSKYSPTEFIESAKYYQGGKRSPIPAVRDDKGYSIAWLHHKGRNKHHFEYWYDAKQIETPVIPRKYAFEAICDMLAAGIVYAGKDWTKEFELEYWNRAKDEVQTNEKMKNFCREVFEQISKDGINKVITRKNLNELYNKCCK